MRGRDNGALGARAADDRAGGASRERGHGPEPVGIGLLSFAHAHRAHWSQVFASDPRSRIVGVWDEDPARGEERAAALDAPCASDLDALLSRDDVDAVAICAANADKPDLVERAARARRHVLIEKSTAARADDIPAMIMELRLWRHGGSGWEEVGERDSFSGIHRRMARHFLDVLIDGVEPSSTLEDGYSAQVVTEAAYRAAETGERQVLVWPE